MDRFPSGDAKPARPLRATCLTTARATILAVAAATLLSGCAGDIGSYDTNTANGSGRTGDSGNAGKGSPSSTASMMTSTSVHPSEVVGADKVPGLGEVPMLKLTVEQSYLISAPPLPADKNVAAPFVQGLEFEPDGSLLMGTGLYGESQIYRFPKWLDNPTVEPANVDDLAPGLFGEGITRHGDTVWQLTWKEGLAIERNAGTLEQRREVPFDAEGWGVCSLDDTIVTSDGSGTLTFRSPNDLSAQRELPVTAAGADTTWLNELECVTLPADENSGNVDITGDTDGTGNAEDTGSPQPHREIWANVWQSPFIYRIDPADGKVTGIVDATELFTDLHSHVSPEERSNLDVLNGIALIPGSSVTAPAGDRQFLLTGKKWPKAYRVTVGK